MVDQVEVTAQDVRGSVAHETHEGDHVAAIAIRGGCVFRGCRRGKSQY
jgi:hypothetical protein